MSSILPEGSDSKSDHPPDLLHAAREWIWRHSSQPDGDRWVDNPKHLEWAAENLLCDLAPWLEAAAAVQRVRALLAEADAYEWNGTTHNTRLLCALGLWLARESGERSLKRRATRRRGDA